MTRRFLAVVVATLVVVGSLGGPARGEPNAPGATLSAPAPRFDAGRVDAGTRVTHTYELRNSGAAPMPIVVTAQCGCTTTDYDRVIPAGGVGRVTVLLDTTHMRGKIEKLVDVASNDAAAPHLSLAILAESSRPLVVLPVDPPTLRGPIGTLQPVEITVSAPDEAPFEIVRVEDEPNLRARAVPLDGAAGAPHQRWRVVLTPRADLPVGSHETTLTLVTTLPTAKRFVLQPMILVAGPLVATPTQLHLRADGAPLAVRVTAVSGVASFRVLHAEVSDPDFQTEIVAGVDTNTWDVRVRYVGKPARHGPVNAMVKLTTDVPTQPEVLVRLSGKL